MAEAAEWQRHLEQAGQSLELWDVALARAAAERARSLAGGWNDALGVAHAEALAARAALLTIASPADLGSRASNYAGEPGAAGAAWRRFLVEVASAAQSDSSLPDLAPLAPEPLADDVAAAALAAVLRSRDPKDSIARVAGAARVVRWPETGGWQHLIEAVQAEAAGRSGIAAVDLALEAAKATQSRALSWAALELRAALCARRDARGAMTAARRQMRELLESWALALPATDAKAALARPDRVVALASGVERNDRSPEDDTASRLMDLSLALASERSTERLVDLALDAAIAVSRAERGVLLLANGEHDYRIAATRFVDALSEAQGLLGLSSTVASQALVSREVIVSHDVRVDPRFSDCASLKVSVVSVLCVPILARAELAGAIYLDSSRKPQAFDEHAIASARAIGSMLAAALLNARVIADLEARTTELERAREELSVALATSTVERDDACRQLIAVRDPTTGPSGLVGRGTRMLGLLRSIERVAVSDVPVLVTGETGSGKELVARAVHTGSRRRSRTFVAINCGALSETLLEAELFGTERGAYTGANSARPGLFVAADGGTLLLDEVGDMPPAMQTALLRVLETSEVRAIGSTKPRKVDVRLIAATHRDLAELVRKGVFREDLRYRLEVVVLEIPPLRERLEDLPELCQHLLEEVQRRYELPERRVSPQALELLARRSWPGNVRELRHVLANAALTASGSIILPGDLVPERKSGAPDSPVVERLDLAGPDGHMARMEAIRKALKATAGHRGHAAELLGISRSTLYRYLEIYEIDLSDFAPPSAGSNG